MGKFPQHFGGNFNSFPNFSVTSLFIYRILDVRELAAVRGGDIPFKISEISSIERFTYHTEKDLIFLVNRKARKGLFFGRFTIYFKLLSGILIFLFILFLGDLLSRII